MDFLFDKNIGLLSGMLDYRAKRHQVLVSNIANIDTPGFKPTEMTFQKELDKKQNLEISKTNPVHLEPKGRGAGVISYEVTTSNDDVKIDNEMANLAENHLMHNMTVEMLARKFRGLNTVLKETK